MVPRPYKQFTGKGVIEYKLGWIYDGDIVLGVREGMGKMSWPLGDYYYGYFRQGKAEGNGIFQTSNGVRY